MFRVNGLTDSDKCMPIRDLRQTAYLWPMWGGIWSGVVFLWRRLICPHKIAVWEGFDMGTWTRRISSHVLGALEHEANKTPDISATSIGSRKNFCKSNRMSVCRARTTKAEYFVCVLQVESFQTVQLMRNYAPSSSVAKYSPHVVLSVTVKTYTYHTSHGTHWYVWNPIPVVINEHPDQLRSALAPPLQGKQLPCTPRKDHCDTRCYTHTKAHPPPSILRSDPSKGEEKEKGKIKLKNEAPEE